MARGWPVLVPNGPETVARRHVAQVNVRKISANEEASVLKVGVTVNDVAELPGPYIRLTDCWAGASRAGDILPAHREREAVLESVT